MHIVIAFLTAVAGLVWALYRLQNSGVDLNAFNPFYWVRRRQWARQLGTKPIHRLDKPVDAATTLLVAIAMQDGILTREQKAQLIELFIQDLHMGETAALEAYAYASHLLRDVHNIVAEIKSILAPSKASFSEEQKHSLVALLSRVANIEGPANDTQQEILKEVKTALFM